MTARNVVPKLFLFFLVTMLIALGILHTFLVTHDVTFSYLTNQLVHTSSALKGRQKQAMVYSALPRRPGSLQNGSVRMKGTLPTMDRGVSVETPDSERETQRAEQVVDSSQNSSSSSQIRSSIWGLERMTDPYASSSPTPVSTHTARESREGEVSENKGDNALDLFLDQTDLHESGTSPTRSLFNQVSASQHQTRKDGLFPDPKKRYLFRNFTGRLGNVMFQLASALCIAWQNNLTLVVRDVQELLPFRYTGLRVSTEAWPQTVEHATRHRMTSCCSYDKRVLKLLPTDTSHSVMGYLQSWRYFEPCKTRVLRELRFRDQVILKARSIVRNLRDTLPHRVLVGVHVRMEDYLRPQAVNNGKKVAPPDYYTSAMTYFRAKFRDVGFVVFTANPDWFRKFVTSASDVTTFSRSDSAAVDMEVLSRLDHLIFSVGTFGWWAAYKQNGIVVCYRDFYVPDSKFGRQMVDNASDYLYPGWVLL